jgi:hypothetical protein
VKVQGASEVSVQGLSAASYAESAEGGTWGRSTEPGRRGAADYSCCVAPAENCDDVRRAAALCEIIILEHYVWAQACGYRHRHRAAYLTGLCRLLG